MFVSQKAEFRLACPLCYNKKEQNIAVDSFGVRGRQPRFHLANSQQLQGNLR